MTDRETRILQIIELWRDGLLTVGEADCRLSALNVHGGFAPDHFTGYDYTDQRWITA